MTEHIPTTKAELLADLDRTWADLSATLDRLTSAQMTGNHDAAGWTVKDHITHLIAWERSVLVFLHGEPRHVALGIDEAIYLGEDDEEQINTAIAQAYKDMPLDEALATLRNLHYDLVGALEPLTDADLQLPYRHYLPAEPGEGDGPPAMDVVYGNSANHYTEHLPWIQALVDSPDKPAARVSG
jgi:hypothetical protein